MPDLSLFSRPTRRTAAAALAGITVLCALSSCGTDNDRATGTTTSTSSATSPTSSSSTSSSSSTASASALTLADGWAKASPKGMSAVFGTLVNNGDTAVHITGGSTDAASMIELHHFVTDASGTKVMTPAADGFTVEPGQSRILEPGGEHIMLMGLTRPLVNGEPLDLELTTDAGPVPLTVMIRSFDGANETYAPSGDHS